jgi:hypothetical protein
MHDCITTPARTAEQRANVKQLKAKNMTTQEIITAAMELSKKDKSAVINALLASMGEKKSDRKMPTAAAMRAFENVYAQYKHCQFGVFSSVHFAALRQLLLKIEAKMQESGMDVISDAVLVQNFEVFLKNVALMQNRWYFENRFTPDALNRDFEKIMGNLKSNYNARNAYNCL